MKKCMSIHSIGVEEEEEVRVYISCIFKLVSKLTSLQTPLHIVFGGEQTHTSPSLVKLSSQDQ